MTREEAKKNLVDALHANNDGPGTVAKREAVADAIEALLDSQKAPTPKTA